MVRRDIQGVEIIVFGFDFRSIQNSKPKRGKQVFDFRLNLRYRMETAKPHTRRREGKVEPLSLQPGFQSRGRERVFFDLESAFQSFFRRVEDLSCRRALVCRGATGVAMDLSSGREWRAVEDNASVRENRVAESCDEAARG